MKKPEYNLPAPIWLLCLSGILLSAGCGTGEDEFVASAGSSRMLSGNVSKGPLKEATIRVYQLDSRGQRQGPVLAQTLTDSTGQWALSLDGLPENLLVVSDGGTYVDEADPAPDPALRRSIELAPGDSFSAVVPRAATSVALNIFTDALLRKSRHESQGAEFFDVYDRNRSFVNAAFGFDVTTTQPADPIRPAPDTSLQARSYAMALGGVANAVNSLAIENQMAAANFAVISALIEDMTDCVINGQSVAGPVQDIVTTPISLNAEILRFRNNNINSYLDTPLFSVDQSECARSGQVADTIIPQFFGLPDQVIVEASDNLGIAATAARLQAQLQGIAAIDDRDGEIDFVDDLPAQLAIGDTVVTLIASDQAGNMAFATLTIRVVAPELPSIIAPSDVVARATGELTQVNLGFPLVADNVTAADQLIVSNNAPASGFAPGQHPVTWTVSDEAGLRSQAVQTVYVEIEPGDDENIIGLPAPDYTQEPVLPNEPPVPPIQNPNPPTR